MFRRSSCSVCERILEDGEDVYYINEEYICESCISLFHETFFEEDHGVDDAVDEMRDRLNGW